MTCLWGRNKKTAVFLLRPQRQVGLIHNITKIDISYSIIWGDIVEILKKGDIVARLSYNKDILFEITGIIKTKTHENIYILKGITERIEADSPRNDLEKVDKRLAKVKIKNTENRIYSYIEQCLNGYIYKNNSIKENSNKRKINKIVKTGKILHLDGDKRYADKSARYYRNLGLNAIVRNVAENKQAQVVKNLLDRFEPDIVILTRT